MSSAAIFTISYACFLCVVCIVVKIRNGIRKGKEVAKEQRRSSRSIEPKRRWW